MTTSRSIAVSELIDDSPISRFQIVTWLLCACVALIDGLDSQSIGIAAPFLADKLHLDHRQLGIVFSSSVFGAAVSAIVLGALADAIGQKRILIFSTILIGAGTLLTAFSRSLFELSAYRVLSGIGLGGAVPCFIALAAEYSPERRRAAVTSLLWAAFPLGGMVGGFLNAWILRHETWRAIFIVGGALPFALVLALALWLPESARFLASDPQRARALMRLKKRLGIAPGTSVLPGESPAQGLAIHLLFQSGNSIATLLLSGIFFTAFGTLAVSVNWTPVLLRAGGIGAADAAVVIGYHSFGALIGMAIVGRMIERFGAARVLIPALAAGAASVAFTAIAGSSTALASFALAAVGVFVGIGASGAIAVAVLVYPPAIRSTGVGWAMACGRFGQVLAPLVIGVLLESHVTPGQVFIYTAMAPAFAAVLTLLMKLIQLLPGSDGTLPAPPVATH
ncbi:MFS transporter [Paraburkholderia sp. BCC1884]|uniref:MFS transporter n=1 Tax=Paraburkholderia sp. BCC1884 TaxID=2562668 RepID=UPI00118247E5|nr:MFS transporter [Paraburkholderia sp. BCC1884]